MTTQRFDYVVVGAGAAGCAVANRLSEDPSVRVLLLEAGGRDWNPFIHMPVGFTKLTGPKVNWEFETVPQAQLNNRPMWYPQGRTIGGSTSINEATAKTTRHGRPQGTKSGATTRSCRSSARPNTTNASMTNSTAVTAR
jgi:choline dehydrogenase-like flavoprotein